MNSRLKKLLCSRVDPALFALVCFTLLLLGTVATALTNDLSSAYDPTIATLAQPTHLIRL